MHDPSAALQPALVGRLKSQIASVSGRVYDRVTPNAAFPYIRIDATQTTPDAEDCVDLVTCAITLHVWSRAVGAVEARRLVDAVARALTAWEPDLSAAGLSCDSLRVTSAQVLADSDGVTSHGVVQLEAQTARL